MHNVAQTPPIQLATLQKWWSDFSQSSSALQIKYVQQCDSTNLQLCHSPHQHNTLLVAEQQTHGHGQFNRPWTSSSGDLIFSIGLLISPDLIPALSLRVGLALAQVCAIHGWQIQLKWPNDVIATHPHTAQKGKLAGILIQNQTAQDNSNAWVVIGIGLNVGARLLPSSATQSAFPPIGLAQLDEAWIQPEAGMREELMMQIVDTVLVQIETAHPIPDMQLAATWNEHDMWLDKHVDFTEPSSISHPGIGQGINEHGAYQVLQSSTDTVVAFHSGQLRESSH